MPTGRKRDADRPPSAEAACSIARRCTKSIMLAHGFTPEMMVEIIRDGLAAASAERAGGKSLEIARVKITVSFLSSKGAAKALI
jgi:hypothetical protein